MRNKTRKLIALFMTIIMILTLFPVSVFAQTDITQTETDSSVTQFADNKETETALDEDGSAQTAQPEAEATQPEADAITATDTADEVINYSASAVNSLENPLDFSAKGAKTTSKSKARSASVVSASVDLLSGEGTAQEPYLIQSSSDWDALSDYINNGGTDYNGKYFKLTDNITVTTVLGTRPGSSDSADRPFVGTFNGAGHTLTVNYNKSGFVAPFAIAHNSTIENLKVKGTVKSTDNHASGLVGASKDVRVGDASYLNIKNVTISTDISCNSHVAGVIGHAHSATITMENVIFNGSISASSVQGGFIGWGGANQGRLFNCTLKDCLFAGTYRNGAAFNPVAYASGQGNVVLTNDFYTTKSASGGSPITPTGSGAVKLVVATVEKDGQVNYFDNITTAVNSSNWTTGSTLKLLTDVTTSNTITVPSGAHSLELNGFVIKSSGNDSVFKLGNGSIFNLYDNDSTTYSRNKYHSFSTSSRTFSGQSATCYSYSSSSASAPSGAYVEGGLITGGYGSTGGGGVLVDSGATFNMYGGNIAGNCHYTDIDYHGGGIDVKSNSTFNMYGGAVRYNTGIWGGGVNIYGTMNMSEGAVISDNIATKGGAGIEMENGGRLYMNGGTVTNNRIIAQNGGMYKAGGIHVPNGSELHIKGNVKIKDNYQGASGTTQNNVFLRQEVPGKVILDGALTAGASIGVSTNAAIPFAVTTNYSTYNPSDSADTYFFSDNSAYDVIVNKNSGQINISIAVACVISGSNVTYCSSLSDALNAWSDSTTLKLLRDVTTSSTITVPSGAHTLDLNGHTVKAASAGYSVITVGSGAELVIDDTAGGGKITGGSVGQNYGGGVTVDAGTLTLRGGAISANANTYGSIGYCGGGVLVKNSAKFYMEGGEISANTSYVGGGVCCDTSNTTVIITGGEIKNNKITRFGSGVLAGRSNGATFRIGGDAKIIDNISTWTSDKDGEASVNFSKLSISGNPTVRGCWKTSDNSAPNTHINLDNAGSSVQLIDIDGALTNESGTPNLLLSPIYRWNDLKNGKTFVFTSGWSTYMGTANPADYFGVDASVSGVRIIRKDGEAAFTGSNDLGDLYITYNANGGTGEMDAQLVSSASAVLAENKFTKENHDFIGWNTKADGTGTPYNDKGNITLTGDVTLYAQWSEKHEHDDLSFRRWTSTTSLPTVAGNYYLGADVTLSSTWNVPTGTTKLCLNGHGIKMTGSGSVITVSSSADLSIYDCGKTEHKFTVNSPASNGAGCAIVNDSLTGDYKTFTGGYITGGNAREGGGINVQSGAHCTLYGGNIIGNRASFMGAGIKISNSNDTTGECFTMAGGAVMYNYLSGWGAGLNSEGSITMTGGTIAYNYATKNPGGIHCHYLYLSGGSIVNNYADDNEYAAGVHADHEVFISGNPVIADNVYKGTPYNLDWDRTELAHGHKLNITGALTEGAQIYLTLKVGGTGVFTSGWKANMGGADPAEYFTSDNSEYSVFLNSDGEAQIGYPPIPDVSSEGFEGDYDAQPHSISVSAPEGTTIKYGTEEGSYVLDKNPSYTDAGTYTVYYEVSQAKHTSVTGSQTVVINQINATVTVVGHNATANYDGNAHSADGYDVQIENPLYKEADFTFNGRAEAVTTNAGTVNMGLSAEQFVNTNSNFATVTFEITDGYLTVNPINASVTITGHNATVDYDGKAHSADGYDVSIDTALYTESDFTFSGNSSAVRTNAGTSKMGMAAEQFTNNNLNFKTVTFNVTDGYVTVNPINATVSITGHKNTADYDGKAHTVKGYDAVADTALYNVKNDISFSGKESVSLTNAGTVKMGLASNQFTNINPNFDTVSFIILSDGYQTVNTVDAVIKTAPHAKSTLDYNGKSQTLCVAGVVNGGTLYYALGKDDKTAPANSQYKTSLPSATQIGNYYIWYKVKADKNHNDLSAECFKVTLANKEWVTISGKIFSNNKKPLEGAEVILMSGNSVVDTINSYENGEYYFTVPKGVYNIVVKYKGLTVTNIANIESDKVSNIVMSETNTDSVLDVQSSDKSIAVGGLDKEAEYIRKLENIPDDVNVTVKMTVKAVAQTDTDGSKLIFDSAKDKYIEYYNLNVEKIIGDVSTRMDKTHNVLEIVIPCSFLNKRDLAVYSCDGSKVNTLTLSDSKQAGTYRIDEANGLVYIYADSFDTIAIAYQPYFSILSDISLGSYSGNVSVKLVKDDDNSKTFELNDISLQNISFTGIPRGTYTMTVSWIDGVENTLTLPFNIK